MSDYAFGTYPPSHAVNAARPTVAPSLEEAIAHAEAAERDAARYRHLRDHCVTRWHSRIGGLKTLSIDFDRLGHDLDAAVDAAMDGRS